MPSSSKISEDNVVGNDCGEVRSPEEILALAPTYMKEGERLDDLQLDGLMIIQNPDGYRFTSDATELASFVRGAKGKRVADLCSGSGIIGILVSYKQKASRTVLVEIQPQVSDMAKRTIALNGLKGIETLCADVNESYKLLGCESFDIVTVNPPYMKDGSGDQRKTPEVALSRHERSLTLSDLMKSASKLLKFGGSFYMVHRFERLAEIFYEMRSANIEPKEIRFRGDNEPTAVLIRGVKGGKVGLRFIR